MSFRPVKPTALTFAVFFLFAISIIAALFVKDNRLWMDEILSYFFITDPSLAHVNKAVVSGIEQTPPLFFNLYWLIGHVISTDILFLKAVSVVLFALTMALFYRYTTRLIGSPVLNFVAITGLAAFTYINITLSIQIRSYALFLLVTFLYVTVIHRLIQQPGNPKLLALHVGMGLLLIMAHNFGLFYLATAGAFFGVLWLWSRDNRYWYVIGTFGLIGAVWLLTWYPYFAMQAKTGEPHSWIPMPTWRTFFRIVGDLAPTLSNKMEESTGSVPLLAMLRFVALTGLFAYVVIPRLRKGFRATAADAGFTFYLLAGFFYAVPIIITLIVTYVHTSLFISRYLWPTHLLVIYQLLYAGYALINRPATASIMPRFGRGQLAGLLVGAYSLVAGWFLFYQARKLILAPATVMAYVDQLDRHVPIFLESAVQFLPSWYYNRDRPIHYLLDYKSAFAPGNDSGTTVAYHTLTGVKNQFGVDAVLPLSAFNARRFPHFYVVDERWNYQIERFIANGSVRVLRRMPTTLDGFTILECEFVGQHT